MQKSFPYITFYMTISISGSVFFAIVFVFYHISLFFICLFCYSIFSTNIGKEMATKTINQHKNEHNNNNNKQKSKQ